MKEDIASRVQFMPDDGAVGIGHGLRVFYRSHRDGESH